jgi:membrane protein
VDVSAVLCRLDAFQRRHPSLAFPVAVQKKFGDDEGGNLCAMLTYYGFLSLFPLLLVFFTVLGFVLDGNAQLQHDLRTSALANLPIIGDQISTNVTSVQGSGIALVVGLLFSLWGGLGVANAGQDAMNRVWGVARARRPGFLPRVLRSLALVGTLGVVIVVSTLLSAAAGYMSGNVGYRVLALVVSIAVNVGMFLVIFRVLTARHLSVPVMLPGAVLAAVAWEVLHFFGGVYVSHALKGMSQTYGMFAIVLGALAWIFLQARVVVYAAEVNVVRADRLWPRSLVSVAPQDADGPDAGGDARRDDGGHERDDDGAADDQQQHAGGGEPRVVRHPELVGETAPGPPAAD